MSDQLIDLSTLVQRVRAELESLDSTRRALGKDALFEFQEMELELSFVVPRSEDAQGGIDLKILSLGANERCRSALPHRR